MHEIFIVLPGVQECVDMGLVLGGGLAMGRAAVLCDAVRGG
jgi:hypothetical protein